MQYLDQYRRNPVHHLTKRLVVFIIYYLFLEVPECMFRAFLTRITMTVQTDSIYSDEVLIFLELLVDAFLEIEEKAL